ncbi:MAG: major tail protein [Lachnospiraceae bacterium]
MATAENVYTEYMGFDNLVYAEVKEDSEEKYETGDVKMFAPAGEIKKSTEREQASRPYDNITYMVIKNEGDDTVDLVVPVLPLSIEADITGDSYDAETGVLNNDGNPKTKYFAIGYRLLCSDNTYRYVWKNKGTFAMGDEEAKSKQGTDTNNATVTFTGIQTRHKFTASKRVSKNMVADERDGLLEYSKWFEQVVTPDNIATLKKAAASG